MGVNQSELETPSPVIRQTDFAARNCGGIVKAGHYFASLPPETWQSFLNSQAMAEELCGPQL